MIANAQFQVHVPVDEEAHAFDFVHNSALAEQVAIDVVLLLLLVGWVPFVAHDQRHADGVVNKSTCMHLKKHDEKRDCANFLIGK